MLTILKGLGWEALDIGKFEEKIKQKKKIVTLDYRINCLQNINFASVLLDHICGATINNSNFTIVQKISKFTVKNIGRTFQLDMSSQPFDHPDGLG